MALRLSALADADIVAILRHSRQTFGPHQATRYAALIERCLMMIDENPMRPSSQDCSDIRSGLRACHVALAAGRGGAAVHKVYYVVREIDGRPVTFVGRVLHERMEPRSRLARALSEC